jgi:hypothetical protein
MPNRREVTEARLQAALDRLLKDKPINTKPTGNITLNKINNEAKLGNSYIHKFPDFVERIKCIIEEFNKERTKLLSGGVDLAKVELSSEDEYKRDKLREERLKKKYLQDSKDAKEKYKLLEAENKQLMFRVLELQEELNRYKVVSLSTQKSQ